MGKRVVGIDLGTTNTLAAWAEEDGEPEIFKIPQLVTRTEIEARSLFPSCLYAPIEGEIPSDPFKDAPYVAGELARRRGAEVPGRLVSSAKSWLCHPGVDHEAPILPWGREEDLVGVPRISPVDASARYLAHVRRTYDAAFPDSPLAEADVILTVPASFDEVARELTLEAASRAGLTVRLLEEPQAAFYDYVLRAGDAGLDLLLAKGKRGAARTRIGDRRKCQRATCTLADSALVLVCDVGGGTTDLSLIKVTRNAADAETPFEVARVAVGHHLLLGGDNMDLALAHVAEQRLEKKLDPARFGQLVSACRAAKEKLLRGAREKSAAPGKVDITLLGAGSSLVGNTLRTHLTKDDAEKTVLEGFFPEAARDARPVRAKSALLAFGLPYERDVAITRHVAWFFSRHAPSGAHPSAILLNGGVFRAKAICERLTSSIEAWGGPKLSVLPHTDPDLGVARGAVAYGLALRGHGRRQGLRLIGGGAPHGYYVGTDAEQDGSRRAVCVVPRGAKEGIPQIAEGRTLALTVGRPVRFDLFASDDARVDAPGALVTLDDEGFRALPPVAVAFEPGEAAREVKVALEGELTAVGTLDLACVEVDGRGAPATSGRRFRLAFQVRPSSDEGAKVATSTPSQPLSQALGKNFQQALDALDKVFGPPRVDASPRDVKDLVRDLERLLGDRSSWNKDLARALFDALWPMHRARRRSPNHERAFWLLAGFCVRPGFGDPLDPSRVAGLMTLFDGRLAFPDDARSWQQFFITWRRAAGGLDEPAQTQIRDFIDPFLAPPEKGLRKPKKQRPEALFDMIETASSLERIAAARRAELGAWILERTWTDRDPRLWAALGRIGARVPAYASVHHVVSPIVAERWIDHLSRERWAEVPTAAQAAVQLARMTGDRARDVSERVRREVEKKLVAVGAKEEWVRAVRELVAVEEAERAAFFGEGLPVGLRLVS